MKKEFNYIYGPVPSWRLGSSLGIDLLSQKEKICNFDCVYCQLGPGKGYTLERRVYVSVKDVIKELDSLPDIGIDYITFSGRGEPSLAGNLGEVIGEIKLVRKEPIAVLTNSFLMGQKRVREELLGADLVVAKLDAFSQASLKKINKPDDSIVFSNILEGIKEFRDIYKGRLALQMMFTEYNKNHFFDLIDLASYIKPDEVQINTPLRHCSVKPLSRQDITRIKNEFYYACSKPEIVSVYDERAGKDISSISNEDTLKRRGKVLG
jgi:wyosine [tRNA(Phe)-imidazoG37] synthetase (radical SAM superfamily)